jgi:oxygen-independent coproporphyrinogen III oxidase
MAGGAGLMQVNSEVLGAGHSACESTEPSTMNAVSPDLLRRFDIPGPRYTSYPTADRFVEAFGAAEIAQALAQRRAGPMAPALPLSLYVHIPFCESLCYYCACNKIISKKHERGAAYLRSLAREVDLYGLQIGTGQPVTQLHLGGGSPTFLSDDELAQLVAMLNHSFDLVPGGERSIEIDPRTVDAGRLQRLAELGFNRISFGVQDFDPAVQQAVHRVQPAQQVFELMDAARAIGFDSVNVDLIYGLPKQTAQSFARTLAEVTRLRPDRIALYAGQAGDADAIPGGLRRRGVRVHRHGPFRVAE